MVSLCGYKISTQRLLLYVIVIFAIYTMVYMGFLPCKGQSSLHMMPNEEAHYVQNGASNSTIYYDRNMPIIFIGGMPRSGTTLMRVLLDTHPDVRCGEETRVIPRILGMRSHWERAVLEKQRLLEAGITDQVLDDAVTSFILEIIAKHGQAAPRLCNKDPFTLKSSVYLSHLFPTAKFVLMIRDGRAVVHSIISRKVTISGFDLTSFRSCMQKWNIAMETMYNQCVQIGPARCMPVYYEQLVLHPEQWLKQILQFLDLSWTDKVLHHEDYIDKVGGVKLSNTEKSTDQVIKPINIAALNSWVSGVPQDVRNDMASIAPMLVQLGYDPNAYPPDYGKPDNKVKANTNRITENQDYWQKRGTVIEHSKEKVLKKARLLAAEQKKGLNKDSMLRFTDDYKPNLNSKKTL